MTDRDHYVVCAICWKRGRYGVPATTTIGPGINTACTPCADEWVDAMAAAWDLVAARHEP